MSNVKILPPTNCPSCDSLLERVNDQLFCRNSEDCSAQSTKKLQNFCKKLKIKGFGEITIQKLGISDFTDLLYLTEEKFESRGFSNHMANKLLDVIQERLEMGITPNDFLAACSIPLIGDGAMRKLAFDKVENITYDLCKTHGIGDKAAKSLLEWIELYWEDNYQYNWSPYLKAIKSQTNTKPTITKEVVCITGKLDNFKNRTEAANYLESLGYEVKTSVTKAVQILICEDESKTSSSAYKKALNNGIKITTIKELIEEY